MRIGIRLAAVVTVLTLTAAGCADDATDAGTTGDTAAAADSGEPGPTGGYGGYGGPGGAGNDTDDETNGGGSAIALTANNFSFNPTTVEVPAGAEISVKNASAQTPHTFTVKATDIDLALEPLETEDARIELEPGDYDFRCRLHPQMTGTLTVT